MKNPDNEKLFEHIARQYVDYEGSIIKQELLNDQSPPPPTARVDYLVKKSLRGKKRMFTALALTAAAAIVMIFALTRFIPQNNFTPADTGIIPLNFTLPENMSVVKSELDRTRSVYTLEDKEGDNVVMTLERSADGAQTGDMTPMEINNTRVYFKSDSNYNLLRFKSGGIIYELSCRYDINTIIGISKNIL